MQRNELGQFIRGTNGEVFEGYGIWYDSKGYPCINVNDKGVRLHVFIWERIYGPKPKGMVLHHKDFSRTNYALTNLELVSESDHRKIHAGWIKANGEWSYKPCTGCGIVLPITDFYPRKGFSPSPKCKPCHAKQCECWATKNKEKSRLIKLNYWRRKHGKEVVPYATE